MGDVNVTWVEENIGQIEITNVALQLITDPRCKAILSILNKNNKISSKEISTIGKEKGLEKTKVFRCLTELQQLGFVIAEAKKVAVKLPSYGLKKPNVIYIEEYNGEQVFLLNKEELRKFIDCINNCVIAIEMSKHTVSNDILEIEYIESVAYQKCILHYALLEDILLSTECLTFQSTFALLKELVEKPLMDMEFNSKNGKQSTVNKNLWRLNRGKLIYREKDRNVMVNSLNSDYLEKIVAFLKGTSYINFDHELNYRRPLVYKGTPFNPHWDIKENTSEKFGN